MAGYARILFVSASGIKEYDFAYRLGHLLHSQGHAATFFDTKKHGAEVLGKRARTFRPTLVLWDERQGAPDALCAAVLKELDCLCVLLRFPIIGDTSEESLADCFDGSVAFGMKAEEGIGHFPAVPDDAYFAARSSVDGQARSGVCLIQKRIRSIEEIERLVEPAREMLEGASDCLALAETMTPSGKNPAFLYRRTTACLLLGGPERAPRWADVACRIAEGNAIFIEAGLLEIADDSPLRESFVQCGLEAPVVDAGGEQPCYEALRLLAREQAGCLRALGTLDNRVGDLFSYLDELSKRAGKPLCRSLDAPVTNLMVFGWFGAGNYGDDLLMQTAIERVSSHYGNVQVCVLARWPEAVLRDYGLHALSTASYYSIKLQMEAAHGLVYCGGLIFDDPLAPTAGEIEFMLEPSMNPSNQADIALLASQYGVTPVGLGIGVGPADSAATRRVISLFGKSGAFFAARDAHTAALLRKSGVPEGQIGIAADIMLAEGDRIRERASQSAACATNEDYFVVSLREWPALDAGFCGRVAAGIDEAYAATGLMPVFVPFLASDSDIHRRIVSSLSPKTPYRFFDERPSEEDIAALIAESKGALAMRLHCSVLHHILGKPSVGLSYSDKVASHFAELEQGNWLLPLNVEAAVLSTTLADALRQGGDFAARIECALAPKIARVESTYGKLFKLIDETKAAKSTSIEECIPQVFYPQTVSHVRMKLNKAKSELDQATKRCESAEKENARLKKRIAELEQSRSYRIGRAVLRPASMMKRVAKKFSGGSEK